MSHFSFSYCSITRFIMRAAATLNWLIIYDWLEGRGLYDARDELMSGDFKN